MIQYLVILGAIVQIYGVAMYIKEMIQGKTVPNRVSWLMWSIAPLIATAAAISDGVGWSVLPVFMSGFGPLIIFSISFFCKNGYWKLGKFDYICGMISILALILWVITKQPLIAIIFSILSDGSAAIPTMIKAWRNPETETVEAYSTGLFNALTSLFAVKKWSISELAFPLYLILVNCYLIFAITRKKKEAKINL